MWEGFVKQQIVKKGKGLVDLKVSSFYDGEKGFLGVHPTVMVKHLRRCTQKCEDWVIADVHEE
jgi:hypothetical protein